MTREALLLARELQQPVMLRTTTRVNHLRGPVTFGALGEPAPIVPFERNPMRFVPVPAVAQGRHKVLVEHLENARAKAEASPWNKVSGEGRIGRHSQRDQPCLPCRRARRKRLGKGCQGA